jgi:hypothetical protein
MRLTAPLSGNRIPLSGNRFNDPDNKDLNNKTLHTLIMKAKTIIWTLVIAVTMTSCIPSLFPLYKTGDLVTDDRLEGTWKELRDDAYTWEVMMPCKSTKSNLFGIDFWKQYDTLRTYRLTSAMAGDKEQQCRFAMHLLKLGGQDYLNYHPVDWEVKHEFLNWHLVETNIFSRVDIRNDTIILYFFDTGYLEKLINDQKIKITHMNLDDRILLMAPTAELQQFVMKYGKDPNAFIKPDTLIRISR